MAFLALSMRHFGVPSGIVGAPMSLCTWGILREFCGVHRLFSSVPHSKFRRERLCRFRRVGVLKKPCAFHAGWRIDFKNIMVPHVGCLSELCVLQGSSISVDWEDKTLQLNGGVSIIDSFYLLSEVAILGTDFPTPSKNT